MILPSFQTPQVTVYIGSALNILKQIESNSVNTCVTSPPYFRLRSYLPNDSPDKKEEIGQEETLAEYIARLVDVFEEVRRVLTPDGTCWLNLGDSYSTPRCGKSNHPTRASRLAGTKTQELSNFVKQNQTQYRNTEIPEKNLLMVPHRVAIALQDAGWYVRSDIVWAKGNPMPESVADRPTRAHEYIFLLTKRDRYFYDADAIREKHITSSNVRNKRQETWGHQAQLTPTGEGEREWNHPLGRNARSVWQINTTPFTAAHFACFPPELARRCILAGCPEGGVVLDPFVGSGTTLLVAQENNRRAIGIELNPDYLLLIQKRCEQMTIWGAEA